VAKVLEGRRLGGVAADVLEEELPELLEHLPKSERALITPHVAILTEETNHAICTHMANNVLALLRGESTDAGSPYTTKIIAVPMSAVWPLPPAGFPPRVIEGASHVRLLRKEANSVSPGFYQGQTRTQFPNRIRTVLP
jgi:hypothetical protein